MKDKERYMAKPRGAGAPRGRGQARGRGRGRGRQPQRDPTPEPERPNQPEQNDLQEVKEMLQEQRALINVLLEERQERRAGDQREEEEQSEDEEESEEDGRQSEEAEGSERSQSPPRRERAVVNLPPRDANTTQKWVTQFCKLKPPIFRGKPDSAEDWLARLEKIFEVMDCPNDRRAQLAIYKLEGDADRWWKAVATAL